MVTNKFFLLTFGCPKNEVVAENLSQKLFSLGMQQTLEIDQAQFIFINTCGFIQSAIKENLTAISAINKNKKSHQKLIVFGCIPQRFSSPIDKIDIDLWAKSWDEISQFIHAEYDIFHPFLDINPIRLNTYKSFAYVEIAEGCSNTCAFCTIPSFKGPYKSKSPKQIIDEIKILINYGVKEIIIIAQETTFYGSDLNPKISLSQLLELIVKNFPDLPYIRIMYAHPNGISDALIKTIKQNPQICPYLDIPLQHIDDKILKSMCRFYTEEKIKEIINKLRSDIPNITIRSTFIVGYPGETEGQFIKLKNFLKEYRFEHAGFFAYENEPDTKANKLPNQVSSKVKKQRLAEIYHLQQETSRIQLQKLIGKKVKILTEFQDNQFTYGRTVHQAPEIDGYVRIKGQIQQNQFFTVKITEINYPHLIASLKN